MNKSQSSLLVLVALVSIVVILIVYSQFSSFSFQTQILKGTELSKIIVYLDELKGFSRQSALFASHAAAMDLALKGGTNVSATWICNFNKNTPPVSAVRADMDELTKFYLNTYFQNLYIQDIPTAYYSNFTCTDVNVNDSSVLSGVNDESYDVNYLGSNLAVTLTNESANSTNDISLDISQVRFFYLYRNFVQWSAQTSLSQDILNCISNEFNFYPPPAIGDILCGSDLQQQLPGLYSCVVAASDKASQDLSNIFSDPYIQTGYTINSFCAGLVQVDCSNPQPQPANLPGCNCVKNTENNQPCGQQVISEGIQREPLQQISTNTTYNPVVPRRIDRNLKFSVGTNFCWLIPCGYCGHLGEPSMEAAVDITFYAKDTKYALSVS